MDEQPATTQPASSARILSWTSLACMLIVLGLILLASWMGFRSTPALPPFLEYLPRLMEFLIQITFLIGLLCGLLAPLVVIFGSFYWRDRRLEGFLPWVGACVLFFFNGALLLDIYLSSSVRSPVARIKGDLWTLTIALEKYYLDYNAYPAWSTRREENAFGGLRDKEGILAGMPTFRMPNGSALATLTTPVAYVTSLVSDPLSPVKGSPFCYWTCNVRNTTETSYIVWSAGPDHIYDLTLENIAKAYNPAVHVPSPYLVDRTYDPSNGTESRGDVYRYKQ